MYEAAFANAALPPKSFILKLSLLTYSIGHEIRLLARNNPFVCGGEIQRKHLIEAVLICHHDWQATEGMDKDWLLRFKIKIWLHRIRNENIELAIADFKNYLAANSTSPPTQDAPSETSQRARGAPFVQRLIQFLILVMGKTELEALNYSYGLAVWHFCCYGEENGGMIIPNASEDNFEKMVSYSELLQTQGMDFNSAFLKAREAFDA